MNSLHDVLWVVMNLGIQWHRNYPVLQFKTCYEPFMGEIKGVVDATEEESVQI